MKTTSISAALVTLAVALAASACGGAAPTGEADAAPTTTSTTSTPATTATPTSVTAAVDRPSDLVDKLVAIDSGQLHIRCVGGGDSTVLLIAGWGDGGANWGAIESALAENARVCSYARFGTGTSDAPATTQTFESQATDLHALLATTGEPGPYVVLGHSFGGAEAVTFASKYPDEVAGLVLLDASPTSWPTTVCSVAAYAPVCGIFHDPNLDPERLDAFPAFEGVGAIGSLGDIPMTVMTAAHRVDPALAQDELTRLDAAWADGEMRWAALSSASTVVTVQDTGHHIELDQPALVIAEVTKLEP